MFAKFTIICTLAVAASASSPGYISSAYALGSQAEHTIRGYGGLSSVSKQAKAIDSAYATVRKTDIRLTNDGAYAPHQVSPLTYTHHGNAYATPAFTHGYAAPAAYPNGYHAPAGTITFARHGYTPATLTQGYTQGFAPSTVSHHGFATGPATLTQGYTPSTVSHHGFATAPATLAHHGYPSIGYTQRAISTAPTATVTTKAVSVPSGLGVAYSPATAVAHSTFSGYGIHYGY